ncbi:MAG: T9SS type A sorting domain-containing protein [Chlorobium sp.]|nr:T9SS type A sorting domain-containing protein [Chlorobium sp.]
MLSITKSRKVGKTFLQTLFFLLLVTQICFAQWKNETNIPKQINDVLPIKLPHATHTPGLSPLSLHPSFYDRRADWQWIIDSTWGPGESLSGKLATFDLYQNFVRSYNSTFLWNPTDWDSLAASQRSKINDSTSRGGFQRILNDLVEGIKDGHAYAYDNTVVGTPLNPGIPLLIDGSGYINHFGAGLTPLADSSLLVYRVVPNHPLGLEPGDIILGYEGVPWHQIVRELLDGNVPYTIWRAPATSAYKRYLLEAAGESWHLFDTIDVAKHSTGLTEHLPLDPMVNLVAPSYIINNEQMPIPGVPMPLGFFQNQGAVTYGIIDGTNIGYIYVYHHQYAGVSTEFDAAVQALMQTDGLIIDIRVDWGGSYGLNTGISRLINYSTYTLDMMKRCSTQNLFEICPSNQWFISEIPADIGTYYDRPVAVLIGSGCVSYGDITSWQLTYVPNAKFFGRPPVAAFSGMVLYNQPYKPGYYLQCPDVTFVDHYFPSEIRWAQEFPDFEEVWLTPDGVANDEDDVVNRALDWMNNLVFPHTVATDKKYYSQNEDTVYLSTIIENPNSHQLSARGYIHNLNDVLIDSLDLTKQAFTDEGEIWIGNKIAPVGEDFFKVSLTAFDQTASTSFTAPNATRFATAGSVIIDSLIVTYNSFARTYTINALVKNDGQTTSVNNLQIFMSSEDSSITYLYGSLTVDSLAAQQVSQATGSYTVRVDTNLFSGVFDFDFAISSNGWQYWENTVMYIVTGVEEEELQPLTFNLEQNYPNPFNPSTTFRYSIPTQSKVVIKVYDILGNEIAILMDEEKQVGTYELTWNAANLPSGVYFYQLRAVDPSTGSGQGFVKTKKMLLLK